MGLFDDVMGGLASKDAQHAALYQEVGKLVDEQGGVRGLAQNFEQKGMGGVISGWIGNGANPPISADQVTQVIGDAKVQEIAAKAGLSEDQVKAGISKLLPVMVNHLTPNGTVPDHSSSELSSALGVLGSKLFGS
jgi:uncharacterized protein YidB (DUF937 family)